MLASSASIHNSFPKYTITAHWDRRQSFNPSFLYRSVDWLEITTQATKFFLHYSSRYWKPLNKHCKFPCNIRPISRYAHLVSIGQVIVSYIPQTNQTLHSQLKKLDLNRPIPEASITGYANLSRSPGIVFFFWKTYGQYTDTLIIEIS